MSIVSRSRDESTPASGKFVEQVGVAAQRVDEHAGLRLECQHDVPSLGVLQDFRQAGDEPRKCLALPCPVVDDAGPERNAIGVQVGGDVDRPAEKIDPPGAAGRVGGHQRRLVLGARVEQEAGAGFDDAAKMPLSQLSGDSFTLSGNVGVVRIERSVIERDRHALVTDLGQ